MANTTDTADTSTPKPRFGGAYDLGRDTQGAGEGTGGAYQKPLPPGVTRFNETPLGGGPNPAATPPTTTDWATTFWGSLGLPSNLISQINDTLSKYTDPTQAYAIGQQILRTSPWYQQTFPGIGSGIQHGLFTNETGYRSYVNDINQLYRQYYGRDVTGDEISGYLQNGHNAAQVGNIFQGNTIANTEAPTLQYQQGAFGQGRLSQQELQAYGQEKAGIDTPMGQQIMLRVQQAAQRAQKIFEGRLATPSLAIGPAGVYSPLLQGARDNTNTRSGSPDLPS